MENPSSRREQGVRVTITTSTPAITTTRPPISDSEETGDTSLLTNDTGIRMLSDDDDDSLSSSGRGRGRGSNRDGNASSRSENKIARKKSGSTSKSSTSSATRSKSKSTSSSKNSSSQPKKASSTSTSTSSAKPSTTSTSAARPLSSSSDANKKGEKESIVIKRAALKRQKTELHSALRDEDLPECAVKIYPTDDSALHFQIPKPVVTDSLSHCASPPPGTPGAPLDSFSLDIGSSNASLSSNSNYPSLNQYFNNMNSTGGSNRSLGGGSTVRPSTAVTICTVESTNTRSPSPDQSQCRCFLTIKHPKNTTQAIAYKIKTTQPNRYRIQPTHQGILLPGESETVSVRLLNKYKYALLQQYQRSMSRNSSSDDTEVSTLGGIDEDDPRGSSGVGNPSASPKRKQGKGGIQQLNTKQNNDYFFIQSCTVHDQFAKVYTTIQAKLLDSQSEPSSSASTIFSSGESTINTKKEETNLIKKRMSNALAGMWNSVTKGETDTVVPVFKQKIQAKHSILNLDENEASEMNTVDDLEVYPVHLLRFIRPEPMPTSSNNSRSRRSLMSSKSSSGMSTKVSKCTLTLRHMQKTKHSIAYKIKTSHPEYYRFLPSYQGVLSPSTQDPRQQQQESLNVTRKKSITIRFLEKYRDKARKHQTDERFIVQSCAVSDDFARVYNVIQEKIENSKANATTSEEELKAYKNRLTKVFDVMWNASVEKSFEKTIRVVFE